MYDLLWKAVAPHLSAQRMQSDIAEFYALSRWSSFDKMDALARLIAAKMEEAGLADVRLIGAPADGRTSYGGWVMPKACDVEAAHLIALSSDGAQETLADYHANPTSLMLYSHSTPDGGVRAELAVADGVEQCHADALAGRLVLTACGGIEFSQAAMRAGALGILCDGRFGRRFLKEGALLERTNEWHNYTIPPWDDPGKGFGFSISPVQGQRLRARLRAGETVCLHALVKTRQYEGVLNVVSGRLAGSGPEDIILTGHYDESGADDNCSQVAVGLEVTRVLRALIAAGELPPLTRGVRLLFPMEARGFNALVQSRDEIKDIRLGLNIDTVGTDQNAATSTCTLMDSFAALPSFAEELLAELLGRVAEENPLFRWRRADADVIDNVFGEPLIGAPTPGLYHYSATHHLALDTPDRIDERTLLEMARVAATYAGFVATAGLSEALWLGELVADQAAERLHRTAARALRSLPDADLRDVLLRRLEGLYELSGRRLASARWLVPSRFVLPEPLSVQDDSAFVGEMRLLPDEDYDQHAKVWRERIGRARVEAEARVRERVAPSAPGSGSDDEARLPQSRCVPLKAFRGFLAFEDMGDERSAALQELGIESGWGAPVWLQEALMFANGKRTAGDIGALLRRHGRHTPDVPGLERTFEFLARRGAVRMRPCLTQAEVRGALEQAGLERGDAVLGHFALSRFGYIEGGADGLIDTLLDLLGPDGTLMMPAFAFAWLGRPPFDPALSPSRVGAVTDRFWRRAGVRRSLHPTHSFAASGRLAAQLLAGHDHTQPPLGQHSPINRLAGVGGKILMFAPKRSNTAMHVGEYLAGLPFVDLVCPILEGGRREVVVPGCPWHVNFEPAYESLYRRGMVRDVPFGESVIHAMRCRDAIEAQADVARGTPDLLIQPGCPCPYCRNLKQYCEVQGRR